MAIRITRNEEGNCITFVGSSNPAYWNACLSAQINEGDSTRVDIINDIRSANEDVIQYEFYAVSYSDFADKDNNVFTSAQEMVDYVNANANVIGISETGKNLIGKPVNFRLDDTHTSIIMDNGFAFGVNTIKADANADGTIHIKAIGTGNPADGTSGDKEHFSSIEHTRVTINGAAVSGGLNDVVNALNELFTVGAFEAVVISDPYSTMVADVAGVATTTSMVGNGIDPVGTDVYANTVANANLNGFKTTDVIDQAGEYFTFDIRNEGIYGFGLIHTQDSYDDGHYSGNATYANPAGFGITNNAHAGFQFSHWFHPTPNGSWTNYGANTSYVQGPGWYSSNTEFEGRDEWLAGTPIKVRVGLDENGFIAISSLKDDGVTWVMHARSAYPAPAGASFHLGIKLGNTVERIYSQPKVHLLEPEAPTMYFRYVESPDANFQYPLFATSEEAEYFDKVTQGSETGAATAVVFSDEPTFTTWYKPDHGYTANGTEAPVAQTFDGQLVNYTEITTLTDADLAPAAYADQTVEVDELSSVNIQTQPQDTGYSTTISGLPAGLTANVDGSIHGTAPEVTDDYDDNPSDDYTITVTRTNSYGSSTGTLTLRVINLTAPATAISGFNHDNTSPNLVDSDTLDAGSAVHVHNSVADGERFIIDSSYVEDYILPALNGPGDKYYIGLPVSGHSFATLEYADWDAAIVWEYETATSHTFKFLNDGVVNNNIVVNSMTSAFYDFAIEINGTSAWLIACNVNAINTEPSPADGGSFSNAYEVTNLDGSAPYTVHIAATMQADFASTGLSEILTPAAAAKMTSWSKALDFSGSAERAMMASSSNIAAPLKMAGSNNQVSAPTTSGNTVASGHPWATAIVFSSDKHSSNQHIWNLGEGAGSTDDNIYLRTDSNGKLYFGWGRDGDLSEMLIRPNGAGSGWSLTAGNWYGIYIAHNGTRYGSNNTASLMADAFDIRLMGSSANWATAGYSDTNLSNSADWTLTGDGRMNRSYDGDMTIGGRGANRNFHGKVASMVVTTLRQDVAMPSDAEIELMITDPMKWLQDYKVGNAYRTAGNTSESATFAIGNSFSGWATQVWLMGDGPNDSYSTMIRNQVQTNDQNYTKLNMVSMVSNDIQNISINGLT